MLVGGRGLVCPGSGWASVSSWYDRVDEHFGRGFNWLAKRLLLLFLLTIFMNVFLWGSKSCPSSMDIIGLRVRTRNLPNSVLLLVCPSFKNCPSARCTTAIISFCSNICVFRRQIISLIELWYCSRFYVIVCPNELFTYCFVPFIVVCYLYLYVLPFLLMATEGCSSALTFSRRIFFFLILAHLYIKCELYRNQIR